jgi:hypothetical protein
MSRTDLHAYFNRLVDKAGAEVQICLKHSGPMGPGPIERIEGFPGIYTIVTMAVEGRPGGRTMQYPVTFSFDDVVWFSTGPREEDKPLITIPSPGSVNPSRGHG